MKYSAPPTKKKMKQGDKINWKDPISKKLMTGLLLEQTEVVAEVGAEDFLFKGKKLKDVHYFTWDIQGDDGKRYTFEEKDLFLIN